MSTSTAPTTTPTGRKRSFDESAKQMDQKSPESPLDAAASSILTPISSTPSRQSSIELADRSRHGSPVSISSSAPTSASNANPSANGPPAKKRKLTFIEREAEKAAKKHEKEKQKAEEKAQKEDEKRIRDEEKRRKEEEKEGVRRQRELEKAEKQKAKDAEKQAKDEKKKKEEEEKQKKEKAQLRLNAFFKTPAPTPAVPADEAALLSSAPGSRRGSSASIAQDVNEAQASCMSLFQTVFKPFQQPQSSQMAPYIRCQRDKYALDHALQNLDMAVEGLTRAVNINPFEIFRSAPYANRKRGRVSTLRPVREVASRFGVSANAPIDLDSDNTGNATFGDVAMKFFHFREDFRPPYHGTYSRRVSPRTAAKLSRRPFSRALPHTNYDYDSEAEWEPPQEGDEDLVSEEEVEEDDGEDDMEGFLDDDHDVGRRRILGVDLRPISTGLVWTDGSGDLRVGDIDLNSLKIDVISNEHSLPIDPYSTKYWTKPAQSTPNSSHLASPAMQPPSRAPLGPVKPSSAIYNQGTIVPTTQSSGQPTLAVNLESGDQKTKPAKPLKMISAELLPDFKQAVAGNNLSKAGLIEVLKKQFPKIAKDVIKDTLTAVAAREGAKEADKIWVLIDG